MSSSPIYDELRPKFLMIDLPMPDQPVGRHAAHPPGRGTMPNAVDVLVAQNILNPAETIAAADAAGLPLNVMCAKLNRESRVKRNGIMVSGANVWGGDNVRGRGTLYTPGADVDQQTYERYRAARRAGTAGQQGVGPSQLTYYAFQDQADALGGCWVPRWNLQVGAAEMARCLKVGGGSLREAGARYNSGKAYKDAPTAAQEYGRWLEARSAEWAALLAGTSTSAPPAGGSGSPTGRASLSEGDTGAAVHALAGFLNRTLGGFVTYRPIDLDAVPARQRYGPQTVAAVADFQRRAGVTGPDADGRVVGPRTWAALERFGYR